MLCTANGIQKQNTKLSVNVIPQKLLKTWLLHIKVENSKLGA